MTTQTTARVKQAEIASGVGAGVLGLGLGVLLPPYVRLYAVPTLIAGALLHGWGMWESTGSSVTSSRCVCGGTRFCTGPAGER